MPLREVPWIALVLEFDPSGQDIVGVRIDIRPSNDPNETPDRVHRFTSLEDAGVALALEGASFAAAMKHVRERRLKTTTEVIREAERILREDKR